MIYVTALRDHTLHHPIYPYPTSHNPILVSLALPGL